MKVIELSRRIIFVNDIVSIYNEYKCGEFINHTDYYIETKHGRISVEEDDYKKVKEYLLSLNEEKEDTPKEDKKIEKLETYKDRNNDIFLDNLCYKYMPIHKDSLSFNEQVIVDKLNEIIDKINGE